MDTIIITLIYTISVHYNMKQTTNQTDPFERLICHSISDCINNLKALQYGIGNSEIPTFEKLVKCRGVEEIVKYLDTLQENKN